MVSAWSNLNSVKEQTVKRLFLSPARIQSLGPPSRSGYDSLYLLNRSVYQFFNFNRYVQTVPNPYLFT